MKKKIVFFLFVFLVFLPQISIADGPATRTLEIVYPQIPGVPTPQYVSTGLPEYVNYIFRFSVILFGILIFGVLIYSGINYLLSFGNPTKLSDATQGMVAAGFGGLILLGAYLIFNTINPQLLILTPPEAGMLKAYIVPGVYICNYNVDEREDWKKDGVKIGDILIRYMGSNVELRTEAAKRLSEAMGKPEKPDKVCFLANYSGILRNFVVKGNSDQWTMFIIPSEKYIPNSSPAQYEWVYEHGIVFHENDKFGGRCKVFPSVSGTTLYRQIDASDFHAQIGFDAKSVTIFRRPTWPPAPEFKGVTLYEGLAFNEIGKLATTTQKESFFSFLPFSALAEIDTNLIIWPDKPGGESDVKEVKLETIKKDNRSLWHNTRSIQIEPKDSYFAVLFGDGGKKCEVRRTDDANLLDDPIGRCGTGCGIILFGRYVLPTTMCHPCLESMYVIKGQAL